MSEHPIHPAADIFPAMSGEEFDGLAADIREHGLREAIVLHDGAILDGRNRYRACRQIGIEPRFEEWDGDGTPEAYVVSKNLHRRHLNESQRAMIGARIKARLQICRTAEQARTEGGSFASDGRATTQDVADMLNISERSVFKADQILKHGTPEEVSAVERGDKSINAVGEQVRKRVPTPPKKRNEPLSQTGRNPERIQRQQMNGEIWSRVRDALTHMTSLPLPADVVAIARAHDKTGLVDARLARALNWLGEFQRAWIGESR